MVDAVRMKRFIKDKDEYNNFEEDYPKQIERLRNKFSSLKINEFSNSFLITYYTLILIEYFPAGPEFESAFQMNIFSFLFISYVFKQANVE